jgi:hypothetical protein
LGIVGFAWLSSDQHSYTTAAGPQIGFRRLGLACTQRALVTANEFTGERAFDLTGTVRAAGVDQRALVLADFFASDRTDDLAGAITSSGADREAVGSDRDAQDKQQSTPPENVAFHDQSSFAKEIGESSSFGYNSWPLKIPSICAL